MSDFNQQIIDEFRANEGRTEMFGDHGLVLLHHRGARTGTERINPVAAIADGDGWLIAASAAGADKNPDWYHNLLAHPEVEAETGTDTVPLLAAELTGEERDAAWQRFKDLSDGFRGYEEKTDRVIPVLRLSPR